MKLRIPRKRKKYIKKYYENFYGCRIGWNYKTLEYVDGKWLIDIIVYADYDISILDFLEEEIKSKSMQCKNIS